MPILNHVILGAPRDLHAQKAIGERINKVPNVRFTGGSTEGFITLEMDRRSTHEVRKALGAGFEKTPIITYRKYQLEKERKRCPRSAELALTYMDAEL